MAKIATKRRLALVEQTIAERHARQPMPTPAWFRRLLADWPATMVRPRTWDDYAIPGLKRHCERDLIRRVQEECRQLGIKVRRDGGVSWQRMLKLLPEEAFEGYCCRWRIIELLTNEVTVKQIHDDASLDTTIYHGHTPCATMVRLPVEIELAAQSEVAAALAACIEGIGRKGQLRLPVIDGEPDMVREYRPNEGEFYVADIVLFDAEDSGRSLSDFLVSVGLARPERGLQIYRPDGDEASFLPAGRQSKPRRALGGEAESGLPTHVSP